MTGDPVEVTFLGADPPEPVAEPAKAAAPRRTSGRRARQRIGIALAAAGALAAGVLVARGVAANPAPTPSPVPTHPAPNATGRILPPPIPLPSWSEAGPAPAEHSFRPLR